MEKHDFRSNDYKDSWFHHLLLSADNIRDLAEIDGFDSSKLEVELKVNGKEMKIATFEELLDDWSDRISAMIKTKLDYFESEKAVETKARELIKEKLNNTMDILQNVEDSLWKLEV